MGRNICISAIALVGSMTMSNVAAAETRPVLGAEKWVCEFTRTSDNWGGTYANVIVHKKVFLDYNPFVDRDTPVWKRTKMPFGPRCSAAEARRGQVFDKRGSNWHYRGLSAVAYSTSAPLNAPPAVTHSSSFKSDADLRIIWSTPIASVGGFDTYVRSSVPHQSWVTEKDLIVGGWGDSYLTILRFNLADIPARANGNAVVLRVFVKQPIDGTAFRPTSFTAYRLVTEVSENVSWDSRPEYDVNSRIDIDLPNIGWNDINISSFIKSWKDGAQNHGIVLVPNRTDNKFTVIVSSDDIQNLQNQPRIAIASR